MTETNIKGPSFCNTTCNSCDVVVYDPLTEECTQTQCDRPYGLGQGTTMLRKTPNPGIYWLLPTQQNSLEAYINSYSKFY